ncbi:hypothetical protein E1301_Tti023543 [Triplophysa tibetana]|uniref:Uncharacterized protein n=1 Tax=Triplophysa tibetana TaxID=1572043 RepID=A0A5A9NCR3_9TELE|nr:hypothetical protein E1301_Tti023543 [Triplophysa tibetana]
MCVLVVKLADQDQTTGLPVRAASATAIAADGVVVSSSAASLGGAPECGVLELTSKRTGAAEKQTVQVISTVSL